MKHNLHLTDNSRIDNTDKSHKVVLYLNTLIRKCPLSNLIDICVQFDIYLSKLTVSNSSEYEVFGLGEGVVMTFAGYC